MSYAIFNSSSCGSTSSIRSRRKCNYPPWSSQGFPGQCHEDDSSPSCQLIKHANKAVCVWFGWKVYLLQHYINGGQSLWESCHCEMRSRAENFTTCHGNVDILYILYSCQTAFFLMLLLPLEASAPWCCWLSVPWLAAPDLCKSSLSWPADL